MLRMALRNALAHKARLAMTVFAVCLGVAFVSGTLVFADSTAAAHRAAASRDFADIAVTVTAKEARPGDTAGQQPGVLDDRLARTLADVPGVAAVRPSADGSAVLNAADGTPLRVGARWANQAAAYVPRTGGIGGTDGTGGTGAADGTDGRYPLVVGRGPKDGGEIAVDRGTAAAGRLKVGDPVTLATDGPAMTKRLVGIVTTDDTRVTAGGTLVLFDRATAQQLFATPGHYTGIDLAAAPGTDPSELARRVAAVLPADRAEVTTGAAQAAQQAVLVGTLTRGYEKLPLVFAGVSLFIASFLIVNTFTMLVARRTREVALLRAIGAQRRQVARSVLLEALLVGLLASAAGFLLGLGIASVLPGLLGGGLPRGPLVIGPASVVAALAVGVGVTVPAAWLPARRAARVAPIEALRTAEQPPAGRQRLRTAAGLALAVLGAALLVSLRGAKDASEGNLRSAMLGCALLGGGLIALAPVLATPVIRSFGRLTRRFGVAGRLARENVLRDPRRTAATAATLMISTALVAGLATVGNSAARALDHRAAAGLVADYVIGSRSTTDGVDQAAVRRVAGTAGVRAASGITDSTMVAGGTVLQVAGVDPDAVGTVVRLDVTGGSVQDLGPGRIAVSATVARQHRLSPGDRLDARIGRAQDVRPYTVVGVYRDNPTALDVLAARAEVAPDSHLPGSVQRILVRTDGSSHAMEERLRTAVGNSPLLKVQDRAGLVREAAGTMGDLLAVLYVMLAVGAVIGALGIVNTLAVSVAERTREIGLLRAVGLDRGGVRRMICLEAVTIAAFGTLLGLAAGLAGAWAVGPLATGAVEHYTLVLPWGTLLLVCAASLVIGALAAALPARRAAALGPLTATAQA
ncbi:ABC transporter permease [Kitasatospora sp. NPDC097691]|uniref:ABC transporter permease n=1 Tax=Kitasatospora sp. NPDC097691 TaxID=3157231 RepID=UPI003318F056